MMPNSVKKGINDWNMFTKWCPQPQLFQRPTEAYDNHVFSTFVHAEDGKEFDTVTDNDNNLHKLPNHLDLNYINHVNENGKTITDLQFDVNTTSEVVRLLKKQLGCLQTVHDYYGDKLKLEYIMEDWKKLAQVVDRIFMVLFFIFQSSTTLAILVRISTASPDLEYD